MGKHNQTIKHKKPASLTRKIVRVVIALALLFIAIGIIGNLIPSHKSTPGAVRVVTTAAILKHDAPNWAVAAHIVAVVRPDDGGKSVLLVNSGHGTASAIIPLSRLGISSPTVSVQHVWTGNTSTPTVGAIRIVLPVSTAVYLLLK